MEFRTLKDYPNYRIYEDGTVVRLAHRIAKGVNLKEKTIKKALMKKGYLTVTLHDKNGQRKRFYVHRLVFEAFFGEIPAGYEIDHINGDRTDCTVQNLRLSTHRANCRNPESIKRYRMANAREKGKYDKERLYKAQYELTDDMLLETYVAYVEENGELSIMDMMRELHIGFPRARRIMAMYLNLKSGTSC